MTPQVNTGACWICLKLWERELENNLQTLSKERSHNVWFHGPLHQKTFLECDQSIFTLNVSYLQGVCWKLSFVRAWKGAWSCFCLFAGVKSMKEFGCLYPAELVRHGFHPCTLQGSVSCKNLFPRSAAHAKRTSDLAHNHVCTTTNSKQNWQTHAFALLMFSPTFGLLPSRHAPLYDPIHFFGAQQWMCETLQAKESIWATKRQTNHKLAPSEMLKNLPKPPDTKEKSKKKTLEKWTDAQPWAQIVMKVVRIFEIWESSCPSCENLALKVAIGPIFGQSWSNFSPKTRQKKRNGMKPPQKASPVSFSTQKRCWNPKNAFQKMFLDVKKSKSLLP